MSLHLIGKLWKARLPLGPSELLVLVRLADFAHEDGSCIYPSMARVAADLNLQLRSVRRIVARLEKMGYLIVVKPSAGGRGQTTHYRLVLPEPAVLEPPTSDAGTNVSRFPTGKTVTATSLYLSNGDRGVTVSVSPTVTVASLYPKANSDRGVTVTNTTIDKTVTVAGRNSDPAVTQPLKQPLKKRKSERACSLLPDADALPVLERIEQTTVERSVPCHQPPPPDAQASGLLTSPHAATEGASVEPVLAGHGSEPERKRRDKELKADFDEWYAAYPRKCDPGAALTAYVRARRNGVSRETLLNAAHGYAAERSGEDTKFTKYPATWLNKCSWQNQKDVPHDQHRNNISAKPKFKNGALAALYHLAGAGVFGPDSD